MATERMKTFTFFILGVAYAAAQTGCAPNSQEDRSYRKVVAALDAFAINLYQEVRSEEAGNVVVSPLSAAVVLALTWIGANGRTAQQLGDVLHLPLSRMIVAEGFRLVMDTLPTSNNQSDGEALLQLANRIYIQNGFDINQTFSEVAVEDFRSGVEALNFAESENARNLINQWLANNTNDKILDAIPPGVITAATRLILVNTVLFSAMWLHQFPKSATTNETFHLSETEQDNVSMMHGSFMLEYSNLPEFNAKAVKLPYRSADSESYMLILLPNSVEGLETLERNLGQLYMPSLQFAPRQVKVHLPCFSIEKRIPIDKLVQQLGITTLFGAQADLSGISYASLSVSNVMQKAYIRVDENGTEAAAATVLIAGVTSVVINDPPIEFKADHPFLYLLMVDYNIIFMGRVVNPNE
ncbi:hypothetical protein R5R35_011620 [Gryllus longicercus]|uniref:Serpin domain-containing protein n=1 Tax=Gryllus longicercus TaxID=2509291 RepID=A0AAN9VSX7_9ORTH